MKKLKYKVGKPDFDNIELPNGVVVLTVWRPSDSLWVRLDQTNIEAVFKYIMDIDISGEHVHEFGPLDKTVGSDHH